MNRPTALVIETHAKAALPVIESLARAGIRVAAASNERFNCGFYCRASRERHLHPSSKDDPEGFKSWLLDFLKLGVTANRNEEGDDDSNLYAADVTLRKSTETWLKFQAGRSEGLVSTALRSDDGGFNFGSTTPVPLTEADANAYRADVSVGVADFLEGRRGLTIEASCFGIRAHHLSLGVAAPKEAEDFVEQVATLEAVADGVDRVVHALAGDVDLRAQCVGVVRFIHGSAEVCVGPTPCCAGGIRGSGAARGRRGPAHASRGRA